MWFGIFSWSEVSLQSTAGWSIIFDQYRPVCISTAAFCYLFPPLWTLVCSSGLQRISPMGEYIYSCGAAISNSFLLSFIFNCGLTWMGRRTEGIEQSRNYADHPKEVDNKKNSGSQNHWSVYWGERKRESHRTSMGWLKPPLAHAPHTVKLLGPSLV